MELMFIYIRKKECFVSIRTLLCWHIFMRIEKGERVLDIGTNNGALLAVAAKYSSFYAVWGRNTG